MQPFFELLSLGCKSKKTNMKKIILPIASFLVLVSSSCVRIYDSPNYHIVSETRSVNPFTKILLKNSGDIYVDQNTYYSLKVEAPENKIKNVSTGVFGDKLVIDGSDMKKASVTVDSLYEIENQGSGDIYTETIVTDNFYINSQGSGNIDANIVANYSMYCDVFGSGKVYLYGNSSYQDVLLKGSGNLFSASHHTDYCKVFSQGSGDIYVNVRDTLEVTLEGSGNVIYKGSPVIIATISGSGKLIKN